MKLFQCTIEILQSFSTNLSSKSSLRSLHMSTGSERWGIATETTGVLNIGFLAKREVVNKEVEVEETKVATVVSDLLVVVWDALDCVTEVGEFAAKCIIDCKFGDIVELTESNSQSE